LLEFSKFVVVHHAVVCYEVCHLCVAHCVVSAGLQLRNVSLRQSAPVFWMPRST